MITELQQAFNSGVLDQAVHGRIVLNLDQVARRANIPEYMILRKMSASGCTQSEIDYVRQIKRMSSNGVFGLVYLGQQTTSVIERMMGVTGACLRNFVDAKLLTVQELLADLKEGNVPDATVLLITNFFISKSEGGRIAEWHIHELLGLLYARMAKEQQTIVYVSDLKSLAAHYGEPMAQHLSNQFWSVPA